MLAGSLVLICHHPGHKLRSSFFSYLRLDWLDLVDKEEIDLAGPLLDHIAFLVFLLDYGDALEGLASSLRNHSHVQPTPVAATVMKRLIFGSRLRAKPLLDLITHALKSCSTAGIISWHFF